MDVASKDECHTSVLSWPSVTHCKGNLLKTLTSHSHSQPGAC